MRDAGSNRSFQFACKRLRHSSSKSRRSGITPHAYKDPIRPVSPGRPQTNRQHYRELHEPAASIQKPKTRAGGLPSHSLLVKVQNRLHNILMGFFMGFNAPHFEP